MSGTGKGVCLIRMGEGGLVLWPSALPVPWHFHGQRLVIMSCVPSSPTSPGLFQRGEISRTPPRTLTHTHTHTHTHTQTHTHTHTQTHTQMHTHTHTQTHMHRHTHKRTRTHKHTHRHTHIHTRTHTVMALLLLGPHPSVCERFLFFWF